MHTGEVGEGGLSADEGGGGHSRLHGTGAGSQSGGSEEGGHCHLLSEIMNAESRQERCKEFKYDISKGFTPTNKWGRVLRCTKSGMMSMVSLGSDSRVSIQISRTLCN